MSFAAALSRTDLLALPERRRYFAPGQELRAIAFAALCMLGVLPVAVEAQVVAAPSADAGPVVGVTANGIPLVQISTPNGAGVSSNPFIQYDVGSRGLILNNSTGIVQTQQAGLVDANPYLVDRSARLIVNEVVGDSASQLSGYTEVAGQRAEVIIANPAGIFCNGCGFINTNRGVLTTGVPLFGATGGLDAFRVTGGRIEVGPDGLNGSDIDQVDLIARSVAINGQVWANRVSAAVGSTAGSGTNDTLSGTLISNVASGLAGAVAGGVLGGTSGATSGAGGALNADLYNRQLHADEKAAIRAKANGDAAEEKRLTAAACYMVRCWAEFSPNSSEWLANYVSPEEAKELGPELQWVSGQKVQTGFFAYTLPQQAKDLSLNQVDQFRSGVEQFGRDVKNLPRDIANTRVGMPGDALQGDAGPQIDITGGNDRMPPTATAMVTPRVMPCGPCVVSNNWCTAVSNAGRADAVEQRRRGRVERRWSGRWFRHFG